MDDQVAQTFRVAVTADAFDADGKPRFAEMGLELLEQTPGVEHRPLAEYRPVLEARQLEGLQGLLVLDGGVDAATLSRSEEFLALSRFGVGYDQIDVAACTDADVVLLIAAGAVDRSMAEATIGWMIAITHHTLIKDRMVRRGDWERSRCVGVELRDRTLGVIGLGGIARETIRLLAAFGMRPPLACDPYVDPAVGASLGVRLVDLDTLLAGADFVSLHCPLNDTTRGLLGARELALMKPDAYLINTARGGLVDEDALIAVLTEARIAGAAIDCFAAEPHTDPQPWQGLDNVILAPHCIGWTAELFRDMGRAACRGIVDMAQGRRPHGVVNPEVLAKPSFQEKWRRLRSTSG